MKRLGASPGETTLQTTRSFLSQQSAQLAVNGSFFGIVQNSYADNVGLTTSDGDEDIYRSLQAGAQGYLLKDMIIEELESAIRKVHAGGRQLPTVVAERLAERMSGSDLTGRELEVLEEIVRGRSNKEIAAHLKISEATVKSHVNNILSKLGVTDRTQAATTALQRGIVHLR